MCWTDVKSTIKIKHDRSNQKQEKVKQEAAEQEETFTGDVNKTAQHSSNTTASHHRRQVKTNSSVINESVHLFHIYRKHINAQTAQQTS